MKRLVFCVLILSLFALPREAAAVPIEYHIAFGLTANGPSDYLGVSGARFDLWTTLDPALSSPPPNESSRGRTSFWSAQAGTRLVISGSAGHDGTYGGDGWQIGVGNDTSIGDYVVLHEFYSMVGGHRLNFGPITARLPTTITNPSPTDPLLPFAFENADVLQWAFSWADSVGGRSRYTPNIMWGTGRPVGVPEPSSLLLVGLGIAGLVARARRRRHSQQLN